MPEPQVRRFPGYGIVYPDGKTGVKVIETYTEAPKRIFNPDGSKTYTTPPPVIHELFGGGFSYADGLPVTVRQHLENITDHRMREKALRWFDGGGGLSTEARKGVPTLDPEHPTPPPETVYVLSSEIQEGDEVTRGLDAQVKAVPTSPDVLTLVLASISSLTDIVTKQGEEIKRIHLYESTRGMAHKKQGLSMKQRWADPEYRKTQLDRIKQDRIKKMEKEREKADGAAKAGETV